MTYYHLGLLGYPLEHSLSPALHRAALAGLRLSGQYDLFDIPPVPKNMHAVHSLMQRIRRGEMMGVNVTIPYKLRVIPYLDELSPSAFAIGAVNTILVREGKLVGENFDGPAFMQDVTQLLTQAGETSSTVPRSALVLGAGGAARAVAYGLLQAGWHVRLAARRLEQAQEVAWAFRGFEAVTAGSLDGLPGLELAKVSLIVNTTPVGMLPHDKDTIWPPALPFPAAALVYDLVYNPPETSLMASARRAGLSVANGLGMLVSQAAMSFKAWTGQDPDRELLYRSISSERLPV